MVLLPLETVDDFLRKPVGTRFSGDNVFDSCFEDDLTLEVFPNDSAQRPIDNFPGVSDQLFSADPGQPTRLL